jgi:ribonuclease HI
MGIGAVLYDAPGGTKLGEVSRACDYGTNNRAEYLALIALLELAHDRGLTALCVESDSQVMIRQMQGQYHVKDEQLQLLHRQALNVASKFEFIDYNHVPRGHTTEADALANQALDKQVSAV